MPRCRESTTKLHRSFMNGMLFHCSSISPTMCPHGARNTATLQISETEALKLMKHQHHKCNHSSCISKVAAISPFPYVDV
jgi:hypothetical protein